MELDFTQVIMAFGIPALALIVFYFLMRQFGFQFEPIKSVGGVIVATLFILVVGVVVLFALYKFDVPVPPQVTHSGQLGNLVDQVVHDPNSNVVITLAGAHTDQLKKLSFQDTSAPSYIALIRKMCAAKSCISCQFNEQSAPVAVVVMKTGAIAACAGDSKSYCCS
ncbi:hypothetical protein C7I87_28950 [Mesorhizobium sp. SARCC-RB16n]|uniref:hypothetical protein n=1 Tax=Mesorhizobium sp. SARCC-RB16n TaxID=2116687 RepID=UPI00122F8908|nr:hypothetical protein [Mesorhizobium sp. SARCC-RB16n]KAA3447057.1 hypothetical protein C7I87_28950 [Mesorhizobium sp. SARCC-RB16n]